MFSIGFFLCCLAVNNNECLQLLGPPHKALHVSVYHFNSEIRIQGRIWGGGGVTCIGIAVIPSKIKSQLFVISLSSRELDSQTL